jgi:helicase MOV-10
MSQTRSQPHDASDLNGRQPAHGTAAKTNPSTLVAVPNLAFRPKETPASSANQGIPGSSANDESSESGLADIKWEYDVYATPFVPPGLQAINTEVAIIIPTKPKHQINFQEYVHTFIGTSFVPRPYVDIADKVTRITVDSPVPLDAFTYLQRFEKLIAIECAAKEKENEKHAMYRVRLWQSHPNEDLWCLLVPGLREDSPHIEMGDILQIRQLYVDGMGALTPTATYVNDYQFGYMGLPPVIFRSWTGVQHNAAVLGINRAQETVYLKADGLGLPQIGVPSMPMFVNVVIPLKFDIIRSWRRALLHISSQLNFVTLAPRPADSPSVNSRLNHFGESPGAKYATPFLGNTKVTSHDFNNDWSLRMLFPDEAHGQRQTKLRKVPHRKLFDRNINYEQAHAVNDMCTSAYGTLPYLISGPPGTGKTKTLVETAMQLLNTTKVAHMLICAPSEAAADTLALRLKVHLSRKHLFRLNRPGRADNEVPRELLQYCHIENDMFGLPPFQELMAFNIVVTSCQDAAMLAEARMTNEDLWAIQKSMFSAFNPEESTPNPALHWGALIIDEAAQATEVDVLPAISVVCPPFIYPTSLPQPRFVMAGDEKQLGPRTASRDNRVRTSLFARLFQRPLYEKHPLSRSKTKPSYGPPVLKQSMLPILYPPFTLLVRNYRSHPAILSVPSALFYNNTLIPEAAIPTTPLQQSDLWRGRKWPVLFLPHTGLDEIERDGGGWYNLSEARIACNLAQTLVSSASVNQSDICIMSPFAAQVKRLRSLIRSSEYGKGAGLWDVNIGPLEAFQGLEKRVVILCTTRARKRFLAQDAARGVGIVGEKRVMNVALTRAKEALFVIGNAEVLETDQNWRQWLAFCWRNGLVGDDEGVWPGPVSRNRVDELKIGVLEKALIAKEDQEKHGGKVLGAAAETRDVDDYDAWVENLRETLGEGGEEEEVGEEEGQDDEPRECTGQSDDTVGAEET